MAKVHDDWVKEHIGVDPAAARVAAMDADWNSAVAGGDWSKAALVLNGYSPDDIRRHLKGLSSDQMAGLHQGALDCGIGPDSATAKATNPAAPPVDARVSKLDQDYQAAVGSQAWALAAELLNGFSTSDIKARLSKLSTEQAKALHESAVQDPKLGPQSNVAILTPQPEETRGGTSTKVVIPLEAAPIDLPVVRVDAKAAEIVFKISAQLKGSIELSGGGAEGGTSETSITPLGLSGAGLTLKVAQEWYAKDGQRLMGFEGVFSSMKIEPAIKTADGFQVAVAASGKLACGIELELTLNAVKIGKDWKTQVAGVEVKASAPWFPVSLDLGSGLALKDVQLQPSIGAEVTPNWTYIAEQAGLKAGEDGLAEEVGDATVAFISFDTAIIMGILLGGAGTIGAAVLTVAEGDEIAETAGLVKTLALKLTDGFRQGASGGAPPGDKAAMPGYVVGIRNFNNAHDQILAKNPGAGTDAIMATIQPHVDEAAKTAAPQILTLAQDTVWDSYATAHQDHWYHSYGYDRWAAWANIYPGIPSEGGQSLHEVFKTRAGRSRPGLGWRLTMRSQPTNASSHRNTGAGNHGRPGGVHRLGSALSFAALVLACILGVFGLYLAKLEARTEPASGQVVEVTVLPDGGTVPTIAFMTPDGRRFSFTGLERDSTPWRVGEAVGARYDPGQPRYAHADDALSRWWLPAILIVAATLFACPNWLMRRRSASVPPMFRRQPGEQRRGVGRGCSRARRVHTAAAALRHRPAHRAGTDQGAAACSLTFSSPSS